MSPWQLELNVVLDIVCSALKRQIGIIVTTAGLEYEFQPGGVNADIALYLVTKRQDDNARFKLYIKGGVTTSIGRFRLLEKANYSTGPLDEMWVASATIDTRVMKELMRHIRNIKPDLDVSDTILLSEDGEPLLTENGNQLVA